MPQLSKVQEVLLPRISKQVHLQQGLNGTDAKQWNLQVVLHSSKNQYDFV